jgi:hypothetical protein
MNCTICNEVKDAETPKIQLLCGHDFHTECWLRSNGVVGLGGITCRTCHAYVIPEQMHNELEGAANPESKNEIIKFLWEKNDDFKVFLSDSCISVKNLKGSLKALTTKTNELLNNEDLLHYRGILRDKVIELQKELIASEEYRLAKSYERVYHNRVKKLHLTWGFSVWELRSALEGVESAMPLVKRWLSVRGLWRHRPTRVLNKFKYYRIR